MTSKKRLLTGAVAAVAFTVPVAVVSANTNKIEADEVRGSVHQSRGVKVRDSQGKIKAPEVVASVIYADQISANTVEADTIYVRDLERR